MDRRVHAVEPHNCSPAHGSTAPSPKLLALLCSIPSLTGCLLGPVVRTCTLAMCGRYFNKLLVLIKYFIT